ncbi:galactokinase [Priestia flexa]|uniref:Galactokinase n=2 Tax=Priestia TaxID=2800373 RepID=A0A0V8JMT1_9BACI|nr:MULTISPECIES: galactokinase [Priestia]AQX55822.1 galactokinase [Priestia flexa]KSU88189.1 galactokinase [Priestia veravalensis]MBY6086634.1 galactokinase [Priestia flexa]MCA1203749.1 galactokinase [Priestia flexa]MCG7314393.1 galactokinase [Priestia flexa]
MIGELIKKFQEIFQTTENVRCFFAPGRVNLIGEHTDYNGGHVFPCALSIGTYAVVHKRNDQKVRMYSANFEDKGVIEYKLDELVFEEEHDWANYPKGVISTFVKNGYELRNGFDVLFYGNIPNGAGLSSSASIELATAVLVNQLEELDIDMVEMVKMSQQAENEFIGVSCGIMDQFAIGMGKEDKAILLNCQTLDYTYSPLQLENAVLVIANTNKRRGLADSKYNERRSECDQALADLKSNYELESLGDLTKAQFEQLKHLIKNPTNQKRAKHAVYENERTKEAVVKLNNGDLQGFGLLMNESHRSLRDDYGVTGKELDALVEAAWVQEGVIGSRMTGAGFGGCTISIVKENKVDSFISEVSAAYTKATGLQANFYVVEVGEGARELALETV